MGRYLNDGLTLRDCWISQISKFDDLGFCVAAMANASESAPQHFGSAMQNYGPLKTWNVRWKMHADAAGLCGGLQRS